MQPVGRHSGKHDKDKKTCDKVMKKTKTRVNMARMSKQVSVGVKSTENIAL